MRVLGTAITICFIGVMSAMFVKLATGSAGLSAVFSGLSVVWMYWMLGGPAKAADIWEKNYTLCAGLYLFSLTITEILPRVSAN